LKARARGENPMSPEQFDAYIKDEFNTLGAVMRAAGTKVQ